VDDKATEKRAKDTFYPFKIWIKSGSKAELRASVEEGGNHDVAQP
jgi:hypothetical protein